MNDQPAPRRRAPSPVKTARTRAAIIAAALDSFLAAGFAATRMADVAAAAGVAKGTLYLYFPDKAALFEGVLRDRLAGPLEGLGAAAPQPGESLRQVLARVVAPVLREMEASRRGPLIRLIVTEGPRFPVLIATYRRMVIDPAIAAIRALVAQAMARGELQGDALLRFPHLLAAP